MRAWPTRPWEITWHNQRSNQKTKDNLIAMHMRPSLSLIKYFRVLKTSFIKAEKGEYFLHNKDKSEQMVTNTHQERETGWLVFARLFKVSKTREGEKGEAYFLMHVFS